MKNTQIKEHPVDDSKEITLSNISRNILMNHLNSFQKHDLEAILSDYTNESILITQEATYVGLNEIKTFFTEFITHFPKQKSSFELDKIVVENKLGYIVWHAKTPSLEVSIGSDTFILKDDKIYQQTFVGQMKFIS